MDTKTKKYGTMTLLGVLVVGVVLISGCGEDIKDVRAEVDSNGNVIVHWHSVPIERDLIAYHVYWSRDSEFPQDNRNRVSTSSTTLSYAIEGLEPGKWYIRVRALFLRTYNSFTDTQQKEVEGTWSETVTVTIPRNKEETSTANLLTYNDETNGFTISYPQHWEEIPRQYWEGMQTNETEILIAFWSQHPPHLNFMVSREGLSSSMILEDYYEQKKNDKEKVALELLGSFSIISEEKFTMGNMPAKGFTYSTLTPNGRPTKGMHVYMVKGQTAWGIGFGGEPSSFDASMSTFNTIISSFSLKE